MTITTSPDLTSLEVKVTWDISGSVPVIRLENLSTGTGQSNVTWAFVANSPTQTFIHDGSIDTPDITGVWTTHNLSDNWPRPFNQIEWSGAAYSLYVIAKDSDGNIFTTVPQTAAICRPYGNTSASKNTYGVASSNVNVKCAEARIYFEDTTYHSYKGSDGAEVGSILKVIYPIDETAAIPTPFQIADYSTALVPITYSSNNYQFYQYSIYDYDLGNDTFVRIRYQTIQTFAVWCNIDLEPLVCEFNKLIDDVNNGNCGDVAEANKKLNLISSKMFLVFMGIMQPLTGVDVPALIEDIKTIGGFDCNCCSAATGIIPTTSSVIDGYNFVVNSVCGDISGTVSLNGSNITFNLQDKSYVVTVNTNAETTAFAFDTAISGCQKTYGLNIDVSQFSEDILNVIKSSSSLTNLINSITNGGGSNIIVDGKCIFNTASSCDYTFALANIPVSTTFALLTSVNAQSVNFAFNQTNISALQSYLNALGYGTFVVTNPSSGNVLISSTGNTHNITGINYKVSTTSYISDMTKVCTGFTPISPSQAVQGLVDFLCGIDDTKIETSQNYDICYIDPLTKLQGTVTVEAGAAMSDFISELLQRGCDTINYIVSIVPTTCAGMKVLFPSSISILQNSDSLFGTKAGNCAKISPVEAFTRMAQLALYDATALSAVCALVSACTTGTVCQAFNYFNLTVSDGSIADQIDIALTFAHPTAVSYTVRYARIDNTNNPVYTTIPNVLTSPYTISGIPEGQYIVGIKPVYSDGRNCPEIMQTTTPCVGINSFSATIVSGNFVISYNAIVSVPKVRVNISYPNGGSFSQIYTNNGVDINIAPPSNVYGDYSINIQPACNENTGYFGSQTAPIILNIADPNAPIINHPTFIQVSNTNTGVGGTRTQIATVGSDIIAGNRFFAEVYSHPVVYVAVGGDTPASVAIALRDLINVTTEPQWNSASAAPSSGTTGFPPTATASGSSLTVVLNYSNQFSFGVTVS